MMTLGELKKLVLHAIATSGTTRAAIRAVTSGSRRPQGRARSSRQRWCWHP
jgi:hypothetical protein